MLLLQKTLSHIGGSPMKVKCYFCNVWLNSPQQVRMYDGRDVWSCHVCRGLVADAKQTKNDDCILKIEEGEFLS